MDKDKDKVFSPADILLPRCDLSKWAVIACDQYTSEPEYWEKVKEIAGDAPSAYKVVLPEIYLSSDTKEQTAAINAEMQKYLESGLFSEYKNSYFFIEREQSDGRVRYEILGKVDLSRYDYTPESKAAVRASEKTVVSRIPPRVEIRKEAPLELPHVLLLSYDPDFTVLNIIKENKPRFTLLYDFTLMLGGGRVKGWLIDNVTAGKVTEAFEALKEKNNGFLFCVGDGNHSLATAKECYNLSKTEKSRYALASVVNIEDPALDFEPIYRVLFGVDPQAVIKSFAEYCGGEYTGNGAQTFRCVSKNGEKSLSVRPLHKLSVGTLQLFLDDYLKEHAGASIDYIHGEESLKSLSLKDNALGFLFEGMKKDELFSGVGKEGSLPRKSFSMGHANDKRFYIEARRIK